METTLHQKKVIESIGRYVKVNNLRIGDKLPTIRSISEEFGFAQVTVSQALKSLARNGFVESKTKVGTTLIKDIACNVKQSICRIFLVSDVNCDSSLYPTQKIISGIRHSVCDAEIVQIWLSFESGEECLKNAIYYHYVMRKDQEKIVFLLAHCPMWVKAFFCQSKIPSVVIGGVEEGISLPNVTLSPTAVLAKIKDALDKNNAYPAMLLMESGEPIGIHRYYYDHFRDIHKNALVKQLSPSAEIQQAQLSDLLAGSSRPRTFVIQGDDVAGQVIRLCKKMGVSIPDDVGIVSLESLPLAEQLSPTITGIYHNYSSIGEKVGQLVKQVVTGQCILECNCEMSPTLVYRESFLDPS